MEIKGYITKRSIVVYEYNIFDKVKKPLFRTEFILSKKIHKKALKEIKDKFAFPKFLIISTCSYEKIIKRK